MPSPAETPKRRSPSSGNVINPYLPQPGQFAGRRILKIDDISPESWLDSAAKQGTPWTEKLGIVKTENDTFEIRKPELLTSAWFTRRAKATPRSSHKALQTAQLELNTRAQDSLVNSGSLRNWLRAGGQSATQRTSTQAPSSGSGPTSHGSSGGSGIPLAPGSAQEEPDPETDFQVSLQAVEEGIVQLPTSIWGGGLTQVPVDLNAEPDPALFLIQVIGISSFLGNYGLGRTVKTFSLLPGENATISTRTWRASEQTVTLGSSIIDSYDESSADRFADTVTNETTDEATQSKTENWHVESDVKASFGFGSAGVSGGGSGDYSSSTDEFSKAVDESVQEHTTDASSHRENTVTSSSESSQSTEDEEVTERTIKNINVKRVLNFTFRELNQEYQTKVHLKEVRIAFSNGNSGSWREEPVSGLRRLVAEVIKPKDVDAVCVSILKTIATVQSIAGIPVPVLEQVRLDKCLRHATVSEAQPDANCDYPAPSADGRLYYRFKRGPLGQAKDEVNAVEGVLLRQNTVVMATDSVVVESLLGAEDALDDYSIALQEETIRQMKAANDSTAALTAREVLAQKIVSAKDKDAAALFSQVFPPAEVEDEAAPA